MKTCLFGGSFDPVHAGHLAIASEAQRVCGLDSVVFLPANCSPFKAQGSALFSAEERLELLRVATRGVAWARVSDLDLRLPAPSWSWRVVEQWRRESPEDELFWLMGTDQWVLLHQWARFDYLRSHLHFIVYHRGKDADAAPQPREGVRATFISGSHPASSSAIRAALLAGDALPDGWLEPGSEARMRALLATR